METETHFNKRIIAETGNPKEPGEYLTNIGLLKWVDNEYGQKGWFGKKPPKGVHYWLEPNEVSTEVREKVIEVISSKIRELVNKASFLQSNISIEPVVDALIDAGFISPEPRPTGTDIKYPTDDEKCKIIESYYNGVDDRIELGVEWAIGRIKELNAGIVIPDQNSIPDTEKKI